MVSNVKRLGLGPRVGRVGLPAVSTSGFVNLDCIERLQGLDEDERKDGGGSVRFSHSW